MTASLTTVGADDPLSQEEQAQFTELEGVIRGALTEMEKAGRALIQIRDLKLYRGQFQTFRTYVETKWTMSVRSAYQICGFAEVVENLRANGAQTLPDNERQTRELLKLPPEEQPKVWKEVVDEGKPTAAAIAGRIRRTVIDVESEVVETIPTERAEKKPFSPTSRLILGPEFEDEPGAKKSSPNEKFPSSMDDANDIHKACRALIDIWDRTDKSNRREFLRHVFPRPRRAIQAAIEAACKRKK